MILLPCQRCKKETKEIFNVRCITCAHLEKLCEGCMNVYVACSDPCREKWRKERGEWHKSFVEPTGRARKKAEGGEGQYDLWEGK